MTAGGIAASDNTGHDGMESFLAHIRNPRNGFTAVAIFTGFHRAGLPIRTRTRGTAKNRNLNVNRDQRSKSEVENDEDDWGRKEARTRPVS